MYMHPRSAPGLTATFDHVPAHSATPLQTAKGGRHV
jgi:hypothetical protein